MYSICNRGLTACSGLNFALPGVVYINAKIRGMEESDLSVTNVQPKVELMQEMTELVQRWRRVKKKE